MSKEGSLLQTVGSIEVNNGIARPPDGKFPLFEDRSTRDGLHFLTRNTDQGDQASFPPESPR